MPIDATSNPSGGGLGPDPASTKAGLDPDLNAAGTGAKSAVVDDKTVFHKDDGTDFHKDPAGAAAPKAGVDLSLDDAGRGAKVDPSLHHDDPAAHAKTGALGTALDHVGEHGTKDASLDGGKHLDVGAQSHDTHDDHVKGLHGTDPLHDDHDPLHGHDHDAHGHDAHGHDAHSAVDHHDVHHH